MFPQHPQLPARTVLGCHGCVGHPPMKTDETRHYRCNHIYGCEVALFGVVLTLRSK